MKYLIIIFTATLYITIISGMSFLVLPTYGEYWGLGFSLLTLFLVLCFGDKFILAKLKATTVASDSYVNAVFKNFAYQQNVPSGKLYSSDFLQSNIIVMNNLFSSSFAIVIGKKIEESLTERELKSLIFGVLEDVESDMSRMNLVFFEILYLCYFPLIFFNYVMGERFKVFYFSLSYIFFPLKFLENYFFQKRNTIQKEVLFENLTNLSAVDFKTALLKLKGKTTFEMKMNLSEKLIYNLALATNKFDSFLDVIFHSERQEND